MADTTEAVERLENVGAMFRDRLLITLTLNGEQLRQTSKDIRALLSERTALLERVSRSLEWRTIDSAPRDGTSILAICATAYSPKASMTWWHEGWTHYSRASEKWAGGVGLWFPTHWMPPPLLSGGGGGAIDANARAQAAEERAERAERERDEALDERDDQSTSADTWLAEHKISEARAQAAETKLATLTEALERLEKDAAVAVWEMRRAGHHRATADVLNASANAARAALSQTQEEKTNG